MCLSPGAKQEKEQEEESCSERTLYVARIGAPSSSATAQAKKSVRIGIQIVLSNVIRCRDKIELCLAAKGWGI